MGTRPAAVIGAFVLAVATAAIPAASPAASPAAGSLQCEGRDATIVGGAGQHVVGTDGDDVIVAVGSASVQALAGDDLICLTGDKRLTDAAVDAGPGADKVDTTGDGVGVSDFVDLGPGADRFVGGTASEHVDDGDDRDAHEADVISTGSGEDSVVVGTPGQAVASRDTVDSHGLATLALTVNGIPRGSYTGPGQGSSIYFADPRPAAWSLDLTGGDSTVGGQGFAVDGFTYVDLEDAPYTALRFRSGGTDDILTNAPVDGRPLARAEAPAAKVDVSMGGGSDSVFLDRLGGGRVDGGAGKDRLQLYGALTGTRKKPSATQRLAARLDHSIRISGSGTTAVGGLESYGLDGFTSADITGTPRADVVDTDICDLHASFGRGADRFISDDPTVTCGGRRVSATVYGGPGNDLLSGTQGNDRLVGGPGRDTVDGQQGRDRCTGEIEKHCHP